jgi:hypothetical protein
VLFRALFPEAFDQFLSQLDQRLDDRDYVELTKRCWDALSWDPHDPRIDELAAALTHNLLSNATLLAMPTTSLARSDATTATDSSTTTGRTARRRWLA